MTDKEIIKALECCSEENKCQQCPYYNKGNFKCLNYKFFKDLLDLINREQATIETLRNCVEQHHIIRKDGKSPLSLLTAEIKAEAIKEFAEELIKRLYLKGDMVEEINNLVKEMVGDDK